MRLINFDILFFEIVNNLSIFAMAIVKKGVLFVNKGNPDLYELNRELRTIPDGEFAFYICDKKKNNVLPRLKYFNGVILKAISENYGKHPPVNVLYRKFEKMFAPVKTVYLFGSTFAYQDLKNCTPEEFDEVVKKVVEFAEDKLGITVLPRVDLKRTELTEAYVDAYNDQWRDYDRNIILKG